MSSKSKGKKFAALVERVGALDVSVLASAQAYPAPSSESRQAARQMIGAIEVPARTGRVDRVANLLDDLRAADAEEQMKAMKRRAGS